MKTKVAGYGCDTLVRCNGTHIHTAVPPISLVVMNETFADIFYLQKNFWYAKQKFAGDTSPGWHLISKTAEPVYTNKNWVEQENRIPEGHKVATAQVVVYTMLAQYRATGEKLFKNVRVRCADVPYGRGSKEHVIVTFAPGTIVVSKCGDMASAPDLGLATEIIPE